MTVAFDTLAFANRLKHAGVAPEQAEAQAEAMVDVMTTLTQDSLATKQDLNELRAEVKQDITELRSEVKQDITELRVEVKQEMADFKIEVKHDINSLRQEMRSLETRMTLRMGTIFSAGMGLLATIMIILHIH